MRTTTLLLGALGCLLGCGGAAATTDDAGPGSVPDAGVRVPDAPPIDAACGGHWSSTDDPRFAKVLDALADWLDARGLPGGAVAVVDGDTIMTGAVGVRTAGGCSPITAATRFKIGTIDEGITSAAILRAETEGKLVIDAPLAPAAYSLHEVMTMTAGLAPAPASGCVDPSEPAVIWAQPGELYNWTGMARAGRELARATGGTVERAIADRILTPLGMATFTFDPDEAEAA
jgi:CubicO group peptidase (beta-lactamase class C family)